MTATCKAFSLAQTQGSNVRVASSCLCKFCLCSTRCCLPAGAILMLCFPLSS